MLLRAEPFIVFIYDFAVFLMVFPLFFRIIITRVSVDISLARKSIINKPNRVLGTGTNKMTAVGE